MRRIDVQEPDTPEWQDWRADCESATNLLLESVDQGNRPVFVRGTYRPRNIRDGYYFPEQAPFYAKCVYCERYIHHYREGDVEHFRPKGGVADEENRPIFLQDEHGQPVRDENGDPKPHPGYYWLAYDWRNLVPSCTVCNQLTRDGDILIGKGNRFPVNGSHAQTREEIVGEKPMLINPISGDADDDPSKHLTIDIQTGVLGPLTPRGEMCIKIFGLNRRERLIEGRLLAIAEVRDLASRIIQNPTGSAYEKSRLRAIREGKRLHTMAACAYLDLLGEALGPLLA